MEKLTWDELIKFDKNSDLKKRPIIIVDIDDNMNKKYNAIVVKYDNKKNVHVRYLDNPFYKEKYWWTGNKDGIPGLNPLSYHAIFLGDEYDEMDGLQREDFQENGYDDIINYDNEPHRFYRSIEAYPYLDGIQGNVHVSNYYSYEFNRSLMNGEIPKCIYDKIMIEEPKRIRRGGDIINNIIKEIPSCISKEEDQKNIRKYLSYLLTNKMIKEIMMETEFNEDEIKIIKTNLANNENNNNLLTILPFLIKYNIRVFDCNNNDLDIIDYSSWRNMNYIYVLKYLDKYDIIK